MIRGDDDPAVRDVPPASYTTGLCMHAGPIIDLRISRLLHMYDRISAFIGA